jgi:hypothetical protein
MNPIVGSRARFVFVAAVAMLTTVSTFATAQSLAPALKCRESQRGLPRVGLYSVLVSGTSHVCAAPTADADGTLVPCLRIGAIFVGMSRESVERVLGRPSITLSPRLPSLSTMVYGANRGSASGRGPHYVVEYERADGADIAFSVQLTGDQLNSNEHLSCIGLGDRADVVATQLGPPTDTITVEVGQPGVTGFAWYYSLSPISFEIVNERVYSLRVWRPDGVAPRERTLSRLMTP